VPFARHRPVPVLGTCGFLPRWAADRRRLRAARSRAVAHPAHHPAAARRPTGRGRCL